MSGDGRVREDRRQFDAESLIGLHKIGPDDELDEHDLEGLADADAGRLISHEAVIRWLKSWGTENELPPPECGE